MKRISSLLLAAALMLGVLPATTLAVNNKNEPPINKHSSITSTDSKTLDLLSFNREKNEVLSFRAGSFASTFDQLTGADLSYVTFTIPDSKSGTLYLDYNSSKSDNAQVTSGTRYFTSVDPSLSDITFVPKADFIGTVTIPYTAFDKNDVGYNGTIQITYVEEIQKNKGSGHFRDVGIDLSWASEAIDYLFEQRIISGVKSGQYNPNASISRGDFILMLCRAFELSATPEGTFSDLDDDSYYNDAISTAKALGIAKGSDGKFNPNSALSRQDAMVLIVRALEADGWNIAEGDSSVLDQFSDSDKISDYAVDAVVALVTADIIQGYGDKLTPHGSVSRAEMAVILYRILN